MPIVTIVYALLLIALGVVSYFATDMVSVTALIPAFFGVPILFFGFLAFKPSRLKLAMHGAATLGLVGILGSLRGLLALPAIISGEVLERPEAAKAQAAMAILSNIFVALCIKSFVDVRRAKRKSA